MMQEDAFFCPYSLWILMPFLDKLSKNIDEPILLTKVNE